MHEELNQFVRNDVWELVPRPENAHVISTKWIFRNKTDEDDEIIRNKSRLVAQGYTQLEGVDFDISFGPYFKPKVKSRSWLPKYHIDNEKQMPPT